ncbi:MAG TPA: hypothetical protein VM052_06355 [Candidatus Limnocylindrales bacterium]|nr:hypothetical protein [Candidatus Limnocylindrales bacterium]
MPATKAAATNKPIAIYIEAGAKRTFACALDWPGWARSGRDEESAIAALVESAARYARIVARTRLGFVVPSTPSGLRVTERVRGDATTDFGAPSAFPRSDGKPVSDGELARIGRLIEASWRALDAAVAAAHGASLAKGPRGGGRELEDIARHVRDAEAGYLSALGWSFKPDGGATPSAELKRMRAAVLEGLAASAHGEIAAKGPRGGKRWGPRKFARRLAWHAIDHAWEIEDRARR